jgi:hypothetical protein
VKPA